MWPLLLATLLAVSQTPPAHSHLKNPQARATKFVVKTLKTAALRHARAVRAAQRRADRLITKYDPKASAIYIAAFKGALREQGRPDEVEFLTGLIRGESSGNHKAVSFIPGHRVFVKDKKTGRFKAKWQPPMWYCGPVQTMCRSRAECVKVQRDPRHGANEALRILRWQDSIGGDRTCNWKHGPFHLKCEAFRRGSVPTS